MQHHTITGGAGARLHVVEEGNPHGQPVLFIHGLSQCSLAWSRQLDSDLGRSHRLVAMDMRGHGSSDKPRNAYEDSRVWADDVNAVILTLGLDEPVLCGWSYGPLAILDYVRYYGEDAIAGIHIVGGITRLGGERALSVLTPEFLQLVPGLFSGDTETSAQTLHSLLRLCFAREVAETDAFTMLGFNTIVPPFVRQALLSRTVDNDDVLAMIRKPVLITHGVDDAVVRPSVVDDHRAHVPHAEVQLMSHAGHAPFWDDAPSFNQRLATFTAQVAAATLG